MVETFLAGIANILDGRLRTASNPSSTWILSAEYSVEVFLISSLMSLYRLKSVIICLSKKANKYSENN